MSLLFTFLIIINLFFNVSCGDTNDLDLITKTKVGGSSKRVLDKRHYKYRLKDYEKFGRRNGVSSVNEPESSLDYTYALGSDFGEMTAETGYGGGGYGHSSGYRHSSGGHSSGGHSSGYGHSSGGHGGKCNSALGLLGVLGLASYLSQVLNMMTTTMAPPPPPPRKKRQVSEEDINNWKGPNDADEMIRRLLPLLTSIAHARDRLLPIYCTHQLLCESNQILIHQLGDFGRYVGNLLTTETAKLLQEVNPKDKRISKIIRKVGANGRTKDAKCDKYLKCEMLSRLPSYVIPPMKS